MNRPPRTLVPQMMFWAQLYVIEPMADDRVTGDCSHHEPVGTNVLIDEASCTAPAALICPVPCVSASLFATGTAVYSRIAFAALAVSGIACWALASSSSAITPVATAAAMLVPVKSRSGMPSTVSCGYVGLFASVEPGTASENRFTPGAITSGFARPSYHVGPRELKDGT